MPRLNKSSRLYRTLVLHTDDKRFQRKLCISQVKACIFNFGQSLHWFCNTHHTHTHTHVNVLFWDPSPVVDVYLEPESDTEMPRVSMRKDFPKCSRLRLPHDLILENPCGFIVLSVTNSSWQSRWWIFQRKTKITRLQIRLFEGRTKTCIFRKVIKIM